MAPKKRVVAAGSIIADRLRDVELRLDHLELRVLDLDPETTTRTLDNLRLLERSAIARFEQQIEHNKRWEAHYKSEREAQEKQLRSELVVTEGRLDDKVREGRALWREANNIKAAMDHTTSEVTGAVEKADALVLRAELMQADFAVKQKDIASKHEQILATAFAGRDLDADLLGLREELEVQIAGVQRQCEDLRQAQQRVGENVALLDALSARDAGPERATRAWPTLPTETALQSHGRDLRARVRAASAEAERRHLPPAAYMQPFVLEAQQSARHRSESASRRGR